MMGSASFSHVYTTLVYILRYFGVVFFARALCCILIVYLQQLYNINVFYTHLLLVLCI